MSFGYERDGECKEILHGVSLTVRRGEVVALVGPSGAGKSTLVNLLPRFFDVTGGAIYLDDHDVRDLTLVSLRKQIGKVTQETVLFNDTVRNNIAYGQPDVPMARIISAAQAALAHDLLSGCLTDMTRSLVNAALAFLVASVSGLRSLARC